MGERGGVINSFKATYGRFPETTTDWQDVIKISNGRWPVQKNLAAEEKSKAEFKKIYLPEADMNNASDNAAVTIITYGLRPARRNFDSERRGVIIFRSIYGHGPTSAADWDIVRAIAYSGAKR